ncbi:MAG TPA: metalloregulator ArsR/SmtB family transcription factor [Solirubrobacteraceae bacterium]|nr:metalloregulator ArsR/SmtB family transcription factor [Solirubrobacteraceae bacterium]
MTGSHGPGSGAGSGGSLSREAAERLADTMFALAAPSRLLILAALRDGSRTVSEIIAVVGMEQSAVSHQLRVLRDHGVVSVERRGRERLYGLRDEDVGALLDHALRHVLELDGAGRNAVRRSRLDSAG